MPITTTQPSLTLNWGIMLQGLFPNREAGDGSLGIGHLRLFGFNFDPRGMADTGGQLLPIAQNTALFSILGTTYGGNGTTNFALPNLDGRVAVSYGAGPGLSFYELGQVSGTDAVALTQANLPVARGGTGSPVSQAEESLTIRYSINVEGIFPSQGGGSAIGAGLIGQISAFAGNFAPNGTVACEGQLLSIAQYTALFAVIGTIYGGDGVTTFALPDLRGRTPIGTGNGVTLGQVIGAENTALTTANLPVAMGGSAAPISNFGPSLGINFAIALSGIFPSRNQEAIKDGDSAGGTVSTEAGEPPYLGEIIMFAGNFAPSGYALANGQLLPIASNQALFSLLGTQYGGNGTTNFALPNLQGRAAIDDSATGIVGDVVGSATTTLTLADFPALFLSGTGGNDSYYGANRNDTLAGNGGNDTLVGNGGDDTINGGAGADAMNGGDGNDSFTVDNAGDTVVGGTGTDLVNASTASFELGADVENLAFTGAGAFNGFGNALANVITGGTGNDGLKGRDGNDTLNGGGGNDRLSGGTGNDTMNGGDGDDILIVDAAGDIASGGAGTDTIEFQAAVNFFAGADVEIFDTRWAGGEVNLAMNDLANVFGGGAGVDNVQGFGGNDTIVLGGGDDFALGGLGNDRIDGQGGNDTLVGNDGNDVVEGGDGNDVVEGSGGDDTVFGGVGDDIVIGGAGSDFLFGGAGADSFAFYAGDAPVAGETDRIFDFDRAAGDRIDLNPIDAVAGGGDDAFTFIGTAAFTGVAGQLRYQVVGNAAFVSGDTNGDGVADFLIRVDGLASMSASDFQL